MIDDNVPDRGHRTNMFNKQFKKMSSYTGPHKVYKLETVINYNGSNVAMNAFKAKKVVYPTAPAGSGGWSSSTRITTSGDVMTKTTTITYKMRDGSTPQVKVVTDTQPL